MEVLQTSALPLGYGARRERKLTLPRTPCNPRSVSPDFPHPRTGDTLQAAHLDPEHGMAARKKKAAKKVVKKAAKRPARAAARKHKDRKQPESLRLRSSAASFNVSDVHRSN